MKSPHHVHFGNPKFERLTGGFDDFRNREFKGMRIPLPGAECAKLAGQDANIRIVNVTIQNIGGTVPIFPRANNVRNKPERVDILRPIELPSFVLINSLGGDDLLVDRAQFLRNQPHACEIIHKFNLTQDVSLIKLPARFLVSQQHLELPRVVQDTMSLARRMLNPSIDPAETPEPEIGWMARIRDGDMEAFRLLVETHQARVIGTISKMLGSEAEAEDLAQQVFIRVWKSAPRYQPTAKFTTWLFRITRNLVFNEVRRKRHFADQSEDAPEPVERSEREPDRILLDEELQRAIQEAINQLPESQRLAIILRRYEELPYEEIAKVMGTTVAAVKSILFRARAELRDRLAKYLN